MVIDWAEGAVLAAVAGVVGGAGDELAVAACALAAASAALRVADLHPDVTRLSWLDAAIVHSIVDLGRRLGLTVVAEGVESQEAWAMLARWGCDEVQGHLLGRPMTVDRLGPPLWAAVRL